VARFGGTHGTACNAEAVQCSFDSSSLKVWLMQRRQLTNGWLVQHSLDCRGSSVFSCSFFLAALGLRRRASHHRLSLLLQLLRFLLQLLCLPLRCRRLLLLPLQMLLLVRLRRHGRRRRLRRLLWLVLGTCVGVHLQGREAGGRLHRKLGKAVLKLTLTTSSVSEA